ncbi:MAG: hypothetical protein LBD90_06145, partial [Bifidobacteriaceae bacterium]|nr:hypothetical protein [Bifidobacteriaceae bacterium]
MVLTPSNSPSTGPRGAVVCAHRTVTRKPAACAARASLRTRLSWSMSFGTTITMCGPAGGAGRAG